MEKAKIEYAEGIQDAANDIFGTLARAVNEWRLAKDITEDGFCFDIWDEDGVVKLTVMHYTKDDLPHSFNLKIETACKMGGKGKTMCDWCIGAFLERIGGRIHLDGIDEYDYRVLEIRGNYAK